VGMGALTQNSRIEKKILTRTRWSVVLPILLVNISSCLLYFLSMILCPAYNKKAAAEEKVGWRGCSGVDNKFLSRTLGDVGSSF